MTDSQKSPFDPSKHMRNLSGKDYLEVKWRLVWLRDRCPDAQIKTELIEHVHGEYAVFCATVVTPDMGSATGWGSEVMGDFRDYLEKAETKALGRALAALGFGTQFSDDYEDGAGSGRPVDSPVGGGRQGYNPPSGQSQRGPTSGGGQWKPTQAQVNFAMSIRDQLNLHEAYDDQKILQMSGPEMRSFIDEYKEQLPKRPQRT